MKKNLLVIIVLTLVGTAVYICAFPVTVQKQITVPYSVIRTGEQLNNSPSLQKWFLPFAGNNNIQTKQFENGQLMSSGNYSIEISDIKMNGAKIKTSDTKNIKTFLLEALSDTGYLESSKISLIYKTTLFKKWFLKSGLERNAEQSLENLKNYMLDTKLFYGYQIDRVTVEDTSFLFLKKTVPLAEKRKEIVRIFDRLINFADQNNAGYNGTRILYPLINGDEITLFSGIGVTRMIEPGNGEEIQYKRMPYGKNLLVASYQGAFGDVTQAYSALEIYKKDHNLLSMAIPYQKILSDGYDFADDQVVQMKVYYPIF